MKQHNSHTTIDDNSTGIVPAKKSKVWIIVIGVILAIGLVAGAAFLYVKFYKIPHDEAMRQYNEAVNQYNSAVEQYSNAVSALEERNKELDDGIANLSSIIHAENLPIDDLLLEEADSILSKARHITKDAAPILSQMPKNTDEINAETNRILTLIPDIEAMGDYSSTISLLTSTGVKYQEMIDTFQGCKTEVIWTGVDEQNTVLRFVVKISNDNDYAMRDIVTEWVAYDKNDAIVGSHNATQVDIPANDYIYYVGGAGSAKLSGTPVRVEMKVVTDGVLTNREMPHITVSNVQLVNRGWGGFDVTADCVTDADIMTANLDGQIIIKDGEGHIIDAEFWRADNLPDSIPANSKFIMSEYMYDLPSIPASAEVYLYYTWQ